MASSTNMRGVELRFVCIVLFGFCVKISTAIDYAGMDLESQTCNCADAGMIGHVECVFSVGINMYMEEGT